MHDRFHRKVWASKSDFTGALAKWLVKLSPYCVPENLAACVYKFNEALDNYPGLADFKSQEFIELDLSRMTTDVNHLLEGIPEIMALNEPRNPSDQEVHFTSRYDEPIKPDDDFTDIMALAQNISCEFATEADSQCWLDHCRKEA